MKPSKNKKKKIKKTHMVKKRKRTPLDRLELHLKNAQRAFEDIKRNATKQLSFTDPPLNEQKKQYDYKKFVDIWNSQPRLIKNRKITDTLKKLIRDILMEYSMEEVQENFEKYNTILGDGYWFNYDKWTLTAFLKSNNGFEKVFDNPLAFYKETRDRQRFGSKQPETQNPITLDVADVAPTIMMELALHANKKASRNLDSYRADIKREQLRDSRFNVYDHYDKIKESIDPLLKLKIDRIIKYNTP